MYLLRRLAFSAVVLASGACTSTYSVRPEHYQLTRSRLDDGRRLVIPAVDAGGRATFLRSERIVSVGARRPDGLLEVSAQTANPTYVEAGGAFVTFALLASYSGFSRLGDDGGWFRYDPEGMLFLAAVFAAIGVVCLVYAYSDSPEAAEPSPGLPGRQSPHSSAQ